jgi:hypothetical protein
MMAMPVVPAPVMPMPPMMTVPSMMPMTVPAHLHRFGLVNIGLRHNSRFDISAMRGLNALHCRNRRQRRSIRTYSKHSHARCYSNQSRDKSQYIATLHIFPFGGEFRFSTTTSFAAQI